MTKFRILKRIKDNPTFLNPAELQEGKFYWCCTEGDFLSNCHLKEKFFNLNKLRCVIGTVVYNVDSGTRSNTRDAINNKFYVEVELVPDN